MKPQEEVKIFGLNPSQTFYMIKNAQFKQTQKFVTNEKLLDIHLSLSLVCIIIIAWPFVVPGLIDMYSFFHMVYT
jgi:hypothetical protein